MCARVLPAAAAPAASAGGTKRTRALASTHQSSTEQPYEDARKARVLSVLTELFDASTNEEVSRFELEQRLQPRLPTAELIAVLEELDGDGYIMWRSGPHRGGAVHRC